DCQIDPVRQLRKALFRLGQLRFTLMKHCPLTPAIEQVISQVNPESSKVARQKWDIVLVAVAPESFNVRDPDVGLGQTNRRPSFFPFRAPRHVLSPRRREPQGLPDVMP